MLRITILVTFFVLNVASLPFNKPCPDDVPIVMCSSPPCRGALNPDCKESFCGGCIATCYDIKGQKETCRFARKIPNILRRFRRRRRNRQNWRRRHHLPGNRVSDWWTQYKG